MNPIEAIHQAGQSIWYDNIQRRLLETGELARMIERGDIRGVTSNPSIFHNAIAKSTDYDKALTPMAWAGWRAEEIFLQLAVEDIRAAADLFQPLYQETGGADGFVSLEVSPLLANDTAGTLAEAKRLWEVVDRPNLMVKIPATPQGLPAITGAIAAGINVNVTLIFSLQRYAEVIESYLRGLEQRAAGGLPLDAIASVASFFVSRVDGKIDAQLEKLVRAEGAQASLAGQGLGKAAIANARLAYAQFQEAFSSERFAKLKARGAQVQRPLWASTSTKNPQYRDVLYVEELIGPQTVNTVPPQTLDAFRDHGQVRPTLAEDLEGAQAALETLRGLGISMEDVTDQLELEGVKAFSDAYAALLAAIETRRVEAVSMLGALQPSVAARVRTLDDAQAPQRLWAHDPALWTEDAQGQKGIRQRLGWLDAPAGSRAFLPELARVVKEVQAAGYTHAVLMGMGGSSLAAEALRDVIGTREIYGRQGLELTVLDSTDPIQVRSAARRSPIENTLYLVASKSGSTSEIHALMEYFFTRARHKLVERAGEHFIAITDPGTDLERVARERKFRHVFLADPSVGGRFSALTAFGLVPAALMGIDPQQLLDRAERFASQCGPDVPAGRNPGLVLGAILGEAALRGRDKLTILADPVVESFGAWIEQLVAESSGKGGKGIVPVDMEPILPAKRYSHDRLFVYLRYSGEMDDLVKKLKAARHPVVIFTLSDPYDLAMGFYRWEIATAIAGAVLQVNPFDQPDVEDSKTRTAEKITAFQATRRLEEGHAVWEGPGGRVYGWDFPGLNGAKTLADVVRAFIAQAREGDYIAINAYLPRNVRMQNQLYKLRSRILKISGLPTTIGFGPRFLHSTSQLHKGGANNGLFLQITKRPEADLEIPGSGMMFGTLERAQALGDLEALLARGKRAIRVHLVEGTLKDLL